MKAELLPGLAADDELPVGLIKQEYLQRHGIENNNLVYVAVLQDFNAFCMDRVTRKRNVFRVHPFEQISGNVFRLEHLCHHYAYHVSRVQ